MRKLFWLGVLLVGALPALAAVGTGYSLFGSASYVSPGHNSNRAVMLVADGNANPAIYSGIDFAVSSALTINDLNILSTCRPWCPADRPPAHRRNPARHHRDARASSAARRRR